MLSSGFGRGVNSRFFALVLFGINDDSLFLVDVRTLREGGVSHLGFFIVLAVAYKSFRIC